MEKENENIILSQWQTCVEMANSISQRRDVMNNLFVTLNLAIIAAITLVFDIKTIFIIAAGIVMCVIWMLFIHNFKLLNQEKFNITNEMEQHLPFQPFAKEWESLKSNKKYREETKLEKVLPIVFIILYIAAGVVIIITKTSEV